MGYVTNSVGLRVGLNRGWKHKSHFIKGGSTSLFFLQREMVEFFSVLFDDRTFHKRGILFSHAVFRPDSTLGLDVDVFIYDPALERYFRTYATRLLNSNANLKHRFPKIWKMFAKTRGLFGLSFAEALRDIFIKMRTDDFYYFLVSVATTRFQRAYPELNFNVNIFPIKARMVNAEFLGRFFLMKFLYRRELVKVINPIVKRLTRRFSGMRVDCSGRFTRRQRASFTRITRGRVSLNSLNSRVDYTQVSLPLKFGVCSIKLWLGDRLPAKNYVSELESDVLGGLDVVSMPIQRQFPRNFFIRRNHDKSNLRLNLSYPAFPLKSPARFRDTSLFRVKVIKRWGLASRPGSFLSRRIRLLAAYLRRFPTNRVDRPDVIKRFLTLRSAYTHKQCRYFPVTEAEVGRVVGDRIRKTVKASRRMPRAANRRLIRKVLRAARPLVVCKPVGGIKERKGLVEKSKLTLRRKNGKINK